MSRTHGGLSETSTPPVFGFGAGVFRFSQTVGLLDIGFEVPNPRPQSARDQRDSLGSKEKEKKKDDSNDFKNPYATKHDDRPRSRNQKSLGGSFPKLGQEPRETRESLQGVGANPGIAGNRSMPG